jgi:hypothetical protein
MGKMVRKAKTMLKTGSKKYFIERMTIGSSMSKGFMLVEVMVATAILSFGLVMIFHSFFISLDSSTYLVNHLNASLAMTNKIWQVQDLLRRSESLSHETGMENDITGQKTYKYIVQPTVLDSAYGFYKVDTVFSWTENNKEVRLTRTAYVNK